MKKILSLRPKAENLHTGGSSAKIPRPLGRFFLFPGLALLYGSLLLSCGNLNSSPGVTDPLTSGNFSSISGLSFQMNQVAGAAAGAMPTEVDDSGTNPSTINPFWIGEAEVTYELWETVYNWAVSPARGADVYTFANSGNQGGNLGSGPVGTNQHPVTVINWRDAIVWLNALTEYYNANNGSDTDLTVVYNTDAGYTTPLRTSTNSGSVDLTPGSEDNPYIDPAATGFRLPDSMEWECAARYRDGSSWTPGNYASGSSAAAHDGIMEVNSAQSEAVAWFGGDNNNSGSGTNAVKEKAANQSGIYDMSGNVIEMCADWHPDHINSERAGRGGDWASAAFGIQVGDDSNMSPYNAFKNLGFRIARTP